MASSPYTFDVSERNSGSACSTVTTRGTTGFAVMMILLTALVARRRV